MFSRSHGPVGLLTEGQFQKFLLLRGFMVPTPPAPQGYAGHREQVSLSIHLFTLPPGRNQRLPRRVLGDMGMVESREVPTLTEACASGPSFGAPPAPP